MKEKWKPPPDNRIFVRWHPTRDGAGIDGQVIQREQHFNVRLGKEVVTLTIRTKAGEVMSADERNCEPIDAPADWPPN